MRVILAVYAVFGAPFLVWFVGRIALDNRRERRALMSRGAKVLSFAEHKARVEREVPDFIRPGFVPK